MRSNVHLRYTGAGCSNGNRSLVVRQTFRSIVSLQETSPKESEGLAEMPVLLWKSLNQFVHFFKCVVKMRRNSQAIAARSSNDVFISEVSVQIHWAQARTVSTANDLRFFPGAS